MPARFSRSDDSRTGERRAGPGHGVGDLDVIQRDDGASSKGLVGTIENTIKADGIATISGG